jgi:hypothetical protein
VVKIGGQVGVFAGVLLKELKSAHIAVNRPRLRLIGALFAAQLAIAFTLGCNDVRNPSPELISVNPATISTKGATVEIRGRHFFSAVTVDLNRNQAPVVDDTWEVTIDDETLAHRAVRWMSTEKLRVEVPAGLSPGAKDVIVTPPRGASVKLAKGLTVIEEAELSLTIESAPDGSGYEIGDESLVPGQQLVLYAVARRGSQVVSTEEVGWEVSGTAGEISSDSGSSVVFTATSPGVSTVTAVHDLYGSDTTGTISVAGCTRDAQCPTNSCSSVVRCIHNECVAGEADKDDDGDGFIDSDCPGGDDCDDSSAATYPGAAFKDSATACMKDADGDGYGDKSPKVGVTAGTDCADMWGPDPGCNNHDGWRCNPGWAGSDVCDGADNDCDGLTDEDPEVTWYADDDGDGYGNAAKAVKACEKPTSGYVADATDCDDDTAKCGNLCFPATYESSCNDGFDNDCDGNTDGDDSDCNTPPTED